MPKLPPIKDDTLEAMYRKIEETQEPPRDYLGASLIGNDCARQIWYTYNKYPRKPHSALTKMRFEDGHRTEELTAQRLRMVDGVKLLTHNDKRKQFGFSAFGGKFKGHYDGLIFGIKQSPKTWHVWECKACEPKKFSEFKKAKEQYGEKAALKAWNITYFAQAQLYMHYSQLDRHYLTVATAGGRDYDSCRTEYQPGEAERYINRAEKIINTQKKPPKINQRPDFFLCRWCDFKKECHGL